MYQDWKQWARVAVSGLLLWLVWYLTQPWAIELYQKLFFPGWVQVSLLVISAGLIFPKAARFDCLHGNDALQLAMGLMVFGLAMAATFLP